MAYLHDLALNKEKIYENLDEKYRHVYSTYEQRTKETLDLQGKVIKLEKKVTDLEVFGPKKIGESSGGKTDPSTQWGIVPHIP